MNDADTDRQRCLFIHPTVTFICNRPIVLKIANGAEERALQDRYGVRYAKTNLSRRFSGHPCLATFVTAIGNGELDNGLCIAHAAN